MRAFDFINFTRTSIVGHRTRSILSGIGIAIGILTVTLLTAIGTGLHDYITAEFTQFGTNLIAIAPGKRTTQGPPTGVINSVRPLSIADGESLRSLPGVAKVMPLVQGNADVEAGKRSRRTTIFGVGPAMPSMWRMEVADGTFLPNDNPEAPRAYAVLGATMAGELFPNQSAVGEIIRVGSYRFRIIGVMAEKGQFLGFDLDDTLYIPAASALSLFNRDGVMEIDVNYHDSFTATQMAESLKTALLRRHGSEDFTITTQEQMLATLNTILGVITLGIAALGGISLLVGAVGILTVMTIAVQERISEIGLLRAVGATRSQITALFLGESTILSIAGGLTGLALGILVVFIANQLLPNLPVANAWNYILASLAIAAGIGLLSGVMPAIRAARIDPLEALRSE
ncbi:MAG: ABC transporter permease [Immundisolibacteraceae bacterium]|nr:ABC transporter permease [Immundisolibacteraceae bacterium]